MHMTGTTNLNKEIARACLDNFSEIGEAETLVMIFTLACYELLTQIGNKNVNVNRRWCLKFSSWENCFLFVDKGNNNTAIKNVGDKNWKNFELYFSERKEDQQNSKFET